MIVYEKKTYSRTRSLHYIESFYAVYNISPPYMGAKYGMY